MIHSFVPGRCAALRRTCAALVCLLLVACAACAAPKGSASATDAPGTAAPPEPLRVLFVGNSFTYFNNLPCMLEQLAASIPNGPRVEARMIVEGGATLQDHWEKGEVQRALEAERWDAVVLQEQSTLGVTYLVDGVPRVVASPGFHEAVRRFDSAIRKAKAKTVLFLTMARKAAPARDQAALDHAYMQAGRETKAVVAPVGVAWQEVRRELPDLELYADDGLHPSSAGSYVMASVLYASLTGRSPVGAAAAITGAPVDDDGKPKEGTTATLVELPPAVAATIQRTAWRVVERVKAAGGYLETSQPEPPDVPLMPKGYGSTAEGLDGTWEGPLSFYPLPGRMELRIRRDGDAWRADLTITFEGAPNATKHPEVAEFRVTDTGVSFVDTTGIGGAPIAYRAVVTGTTMTGIAEFGRADSPPFAIGSWNLTRRPETR